MNRASLVAFAFVLGCSSPASGPGPTPPSPPPAGSDSQAGSASAQGLGDKCGENGACPTGQACVKYFGIAGPSGPQFESCEISCTGEAPCPSGTKCVTIADGPGQVCRP